MSEAANRPDAWNSVAECRRLVFLELESLPARTRSRLASAITSSLRIAGLLGPRVEQHYSATDAASLLGRRCRRWAVIHAERGDFGPVSRDGNDWLLPASGLELYLAAHAVESSTARKKAGANMGAIAREKVSKWSVWSDGRERTPGGRFAGCADAFSVANGRNSLSVNASRNGAAESRHAAAQCEEGGGGESASGEARPGAMDPGERGFAGKGDPLHVNGD